MALERIKTISAEEKLLILRTRLQLEGLATIVAIAVGFALTIFDPAFSGQWWFDVICSVALFISFCYVVESKILPDELQKLRKNQTDDVKEQAKRIKRAMYYLEFPTKEEVEFRKRLTVESKDMTEEEVACILVYLDAMEPLGKVLANKHLSPHDRVRGQNQLEQLRLELRRSLEIEAKNAQVLASQALDLALMGLSPVAE